ncbi:MAG TPA: hypothetical protein VN660_14320 [Steroidobacteraceae bacterium]|nr:hypothetical protein [Steroidobacteraceae bacterium]
MADTNEQHIVQLRQRLHASREEFFGLAEAMRGHASPALQAHGEPEDGGFPHSRLMRALIGKRVGVALGTAAVAATVLRPRLLMGALRLTPMLRPLLMRYVLPRLLRQR